MDPMDRKSDNLPDGNWEKDLAAIENAYSGFEAVEPPELSDLAVLNAARRELSNKKRKPLRWVGAFATASVMVIALSLVIQQKPEPAQLERPNGIKTDSAIENGSTLGTAADAPGPAHSLPDPAVIAADSDAVSERSRMQSQAAIQKREDGNLLEASSAQSSETDNAVSQSGPSALIGGQAAKENMPTKVAEQETPSEPALRDQAGESKSVARQGFMRAEEEKDEARVSGVNLQDDTLLKTVEPDESPAEQRDPEEWVQALLELSKTGQHENLELELAAFKKAFPDYELPPELAD